jgi:hypothetical protein
MPGNTERILSYLPPTFRALPRPTALFAVVDGAGEQLLQAESSLGAVMLSHWVDHADRGAQFISDLACFAALYGLAPRGAAKDVARFQMPTCVPLSTDETVEEFREHLKRYVLTYLDGTVSVQGILRIVAEALGLHIADTYAEMDTWWTRPDDLFITTVHRKDDAAGVLFGAAAAQVAHGAAGSSAMVAGTKALPTRFDLSSPSELRIAIDGAKPVTIDLTLGKNATLGEVIQRINATAATAAGAEGHLSISSRTAGPQSRLEFVEGPGDASYFLLGLRPLTFFGNNAEAAEVTGTVSLEGEFDLRGHRFLRLLIDDESAEVDCGGASPGKRTLSDVVAAINGAFKKPVASASNHFLKLRSPTIGAFSRIAFQSPASQDAKEFLFGSVDRVFFGADAAAASVTGDVVIPGFFDTFDFSAFATLRIAVDAAPPVEINCAGKVPGATDVSEFIDAVNGALGATIAVLDSDGEEEVLVFRSTTVGSSSRLRFAVGDKPDASLVLFGIHPRAFVGGGPTSARLVGTTDLSQGADLRSRYVVEVAIDGGNPVEIDLRSASTNLAAVSLAELCSTLNAALGGDFASNDGTHLILTSNTKGVISSVAVLPAQDTSIRRFVTRAFITDDAATKVLGFTRFKAAGANAPPARLESRMDLSQGVDLRTNRFLRIAIDPAEAREVDCAARARIPRAATLTEITDAINASFSAPLASHDGRHLMLISPGAGVSGSIALEPTLAVDATASLIGTGLHSASGRSATGVRFTGTVDLSRGVDLRHHDTVRIAVDDAEPVEIVCAGPDPQFTTLDQIVERINQVFPNVSLHDGKQIRLVSHSVGPKSRIEFAAPAARDASAAVFGITLPRVYRGDAPGNAVIKGSVDLRHGVDLSTARFLCLAVNGAPPSAIDCSEAAVDKTRAQLPEIVKAINEATSSSVAASDGIHLILRSPKEGVHERLDLTPCNKGDARTSLFGQGPYEAKGGNPESASIRGKTDLHHPVDLAGHSILRLAVDGRPPVDIDVAGAAPDRTTLPEIVDRINATLPETAVGDNGHLALFSPTAGEYGSVEVLPVRALELIDYPATPVTESPLTLQESNQFSVNNNGAADSELEFDLAAPQGESGMEFVDRTDGTRIRVRGAVVAGGKLALRPCGDIGVLAEVTSADGTVKRLSDSSILAGAIGAQALVPFGGEWPLSRPGGPDQRPAIQLNNPGAPSIVVVRALSQLEAGGFITIQVTEARPPIGGSRIVSLRSGYLYAIGRLRRGEAGYRLVDESEATIFEVRAEPQVEILRSPDRLVAVSGSVLEKSGWTRIVVADRIMPLFDVRLRHTGPAGKSTAEVYAGVTIGLGDTPVSLQVKILERPSQLVFASELGKAVPLSFPRGSRQLTYMNCHEARFNHVVFAPGAASEASNGEVARFAGGRCREFAVFDISRFTDNRPDGEAALFGFSSPSDPTVQVETDWIRYQPGEFIVNLPADLDEEFGAHFNKGRFGPAKGKPELYEGVITEPATDPDYIVKRINSKSTLVKAAAFPRSTPPPGFEAFNMPFLNPRSHALSGGHDSEFARIYLAENGVPGLIELQARVKGVWGNSIAVTAKQAGAVRFDITVGFEGLRFENAREVALAGRILRPGEDPLSQVAAQILKPSPVGVLQAKAAGIRADVTRDRTAVPPAQDSCRPISAGMGRKQRRQHNGQRY